MKPIIRFPTIDRRALLSSLAILPLLSASLRSTTAEAQAQRDPLPSWNDGATKSSILDFVARVTTQGGSDFVPVDQRIATFDNDGTLWVEQPMYVQLAFALDRVKALAPMHPEWKATQPFAAVLDGDLKAVVAFGEKGLVELVAVTHAGMTTAEFEKITADWLATARDHRFNRPYTELVYQPMLELARLSPRQWFQDIHRIRRRYRVHTAMVRADLRNTSGASHRLIDQDPFPNERRRANALPPTRY